MDDAEPTAVQQVQEPLSPPSAAQENSLLEEHTNTLWPRVADLQGMTLHTVTGRPFVVVSVDPAHKVAVKIKTSTGRLRGINRRDIEDAYRFALRMGREVRPGELGGVLLNNWTTSSVAGIINTISGFGEVH